MNIRPYKQEDALGLLDDPEEKAWALVNETYGPGVTYEMDGKVIACAGIRTLGMGEIWAVFGDGAKGIKFTLGKEAKKQVLDMMDENGLWLVIATVDDEVSVPQRRFLEMLGFTKTECYTYRRE